MLELFRSHWVRTRKPTTCLFCGNAIPKGLQAVYEGGKGDDGFISWRVCAACEPFMDEFWAWRGDAECEHPSESFAEFMEEKDYWNDEFNWSEDAKKALGGVR